MTPEIFVLEVEGVPQIFLQLVPWIDCKLINSNSFAFIKPGLILIPVENVPKFRFCRPESRVTRSDRCFHQPIEPGTSKPMNLNVWVEVLDPFDGMVEIGEGPALF